MRWLQASIRQASLVGLGLAVSAGTAAAILPGVTLPPDLTEPPAAGRRGILEIDGRNIHNCGNMLLHTTNFGLFGSLPRSNFPFSGAASLQWPAGSLAEYLWGGGLWVGAILNGEPHVTTALAPNTLLGSEFRPGASILDHIYRTRENAPGGARRPSPNADDDRDGREDEDRLDGRDNDGDGRIDEDFAALSDQMFFCEYGDRDPNIRLVHPDHVPLGLHVQQSSLCWEQPLTDDFIAFDFKLIHLGADPLDQVYVGFFADFDVGPRHLRESAEDDHAGFWEGVVPARIGNATKNVKVSIGYMFDDDTDAGEVEGYAGIAFLGAQAPDSDGIQRPVPLRNFRFFSGRAPFETGGDPTTDAERYRVMDGSSLRSLPPPDPATGFRPPQLTRRPDDYRVVVSAGPFVRVEPGDSIGFQAALVVGKGFEGLIANAAQAQLTFDGVYLDCDGDPTTGVDGRESSICAPNEGLFRIDPCDRLCNAAPQTPGCLERVPVDGCLYVNADCEQERLTGIRTGVDGKECLVHWLVGTAPTPPSMRLVGSAGRVDILWDNRSERIPDLRLGVVDFESYRLWRADNWRRPLGTDERIGPSAELWALLAEYDVAGNRIGSDTGLESIAYSPNVPDAAIEFYREWFQLHPFTPPPVYPGLDAAQADTAQGMARGVRYYRYTDPQFLRPARIGQPCRADVPCGTIAGPNGPLPTRCNRDGFCQATAASPHPGSHLFYAVTATDHKLEADASGLLVTAGPGLAGQPSSNFVYFTPPTAALAAERWEDAAREIYVVPNPVTRASLDPWRLQPKNDDPSGVKVEFHHLPAAAGRVKVFTLAGDFVVEVQFDGRAGNGSAAWDLLSRNGQEIASGVYLYVVEADDPRWRRFVGRFVVVR